MENLQKSTVANDNPMLLGVMGKNQINIDENIICEAILSSFFKQGLLTEREFVLIKNNLANGHAW